MQHRIFQLSLWAAAASFALALAGCSASADLSKVDHTRGRPTQRFDAFQGAASNGKVLVVVGNNGIVVASHDQGATWQRRELGQDAALVGVAACADGSFAALDFFRRVWLADAGAATWQAREIKEAATPLAITCDAANRLWVVGSGATIAVSGDRGANWTKTVVGDDLMLASVQFVDDRRGFITGEFGSVFATTDGGATWAAKTTIGPDFYPYAAHFSQAGEGWVAGLAGVVMHTNDGGESWQKAANPLGAPIYGLAVAGADPIGVGINGLMFRFRDGHWRFDGARPAAYLRAVLPLPDGRLLLAGGSGTVEVTTPAGPAAAAN